MNREELIQKGENLLQNLNIEGLKFLEGFVGDLYKIEKYNVNTTPERFRQIEQQENEEWKCECALREAKEHEEFMERMKTQIEQRKANIAALEGGDRRFWNKIEKVRKMNIGRYTMNYEQHDLLEKLYRGDLFDMRHVSFAYGFYQGMQYMKNRKKKGGKA